MVIFILISDFSSLHDDQYYVCIYIQQPTLGTIQVISDWLTGIKSSVMKRREEKERETCRGMIGRVANQAIVPSPLAALPGWFKPNQYYIVGSYRFFAP